MKSTTSFGTWVQQQRRTLDWTQAELAANVGCALVTIRKIEQDLRRPSRELAELLAEQLQIPTIERDYFVAVARRQDLPTDVELTSVSPARLPSNVPPQQSGPTADMVRFVGRQHELLHLEQAMAHVAAGQGQIRFVTGEAGRGKTSLLLAFAQQAQRRQHGLIVAGGSCNAFAGAGDPYYDNVKLEALRACVGGNCGSVCGYRDVRQQERRPAWERVEGGA